MKHRWQQQYMAAALRASEDEWERASSVSGHTSPAYGTQPSNFPQPYPPFPMYGYAPPQSSGSPMSWMFPYPPSLASSPHRAFPPHPIAGSPGMYGYGTGAQSVFSGELGPRPATHSQLHSKTASSPDAGRGRYRDPRLEQQAASSPLGRHKQVPINFISPSASSVWEKSKADWDEMRTPRKQRLSTQFIN